MKFEEFVALFGGLNAVEFKARFAHPFLLEVPSGAVQRAERRLFLCRGSKGKPLTVGRGPRCHVPVRDKLVSTRHAELRPPQADGDGWELCDVGSTNGTFLGRAKLPPNEAVPLADGAQITFGRDATFRFLSADGLLEHLDGVGPDALEPDETGDLGATLQRVSVAAQDRPTARRAKVPVADPGSPTDDLLVLCDGQDPVPLDLDRTVVIGRKAEHAQVVLADGRVSRAHAEVKRSPEGLFVRDLGSSNGTFVGGREVGREWERLELGQVVSVGPFDLYVSAPQAYGTATWGEDDETGTISVP